MTTRLWPTGMARGKLTRVAALLIMVVSLTSGLMMDQAMSQAQSAEFAVGATVVVDTDQLNLRSAVGTSASIIRVLAEGTELTITDGPEAANGYTWYQVKTTGGTAGWVAGEYLALPSGDVEGEYAVGDIAVVDTARLNCRTGPGLDYSVSYVMNGGTVVEILDGPRSADGYHWYKVETDDGDIGWVIGEALAPDDGSSGPIDPAFDVGDTVVVNTDRLNLRSAAGTSASILTVLPYGTSLTITGTPVAASGYTWYPVETASGSDGWVVGSYLAVWSAPIGGEFEAGDIVYVDAPWLNCRVGPGLDYAVDHVMAGGSEVVVLDGPVAADSYHWYELEMTNGDVAWAIGEGLTAESGSVDPGFDVGDTVMVSTDRLNLRSAAGTTASVITVLPYGTQLTITGGPQTANGYTWYPVKTAGGTAGWVAGEFLS